MRTWRDFFKPIIRDCLKENAGMPNKVIKKALRARYSSLGDIRGSHPLNIWRNEVRIQRGNGKPVVYRQPLASTLSQLFPEKEIKIKKSKKQKLKKSNKNEGQINKTH